jgi:hypothetical protein
MAEYSDFKELMSTVGLALHGWSQVETGTGILFIVVSGIRSADQAGAIFDSIVDFRSRLSMLDAAIEHSNLANANEKEIWTCLSARLRKLYKRRHEIAHFAIADDEIASARQISPFFTFNKYLQKTHRSLSVEQILNRTRQFGDAAEAIQWFVRFTSERLPREGHLGGPAEAPPLIVRIQGLLRRTQVETAPPPQSSRE